MTLLLKQVNLPHKKTKGTKYERGRPFAAISDIYVTFAGCCR